MELIHHRRDGLLEICELRGRGGGIKKQKMGGYKGWFQVKTLWCGIQQVVADFKSGNTPHQRRKTGHIPFIHSNVLSQQTNGSDDKVSTPVPLLP